MSESIICIRRMQLDDVDQVHTVDRLSFSHPWPRRSYIFDLQNNPNAHLWVAEAQHPGGEELVVGMLVLWMVIDEAHVGTLAVHPQYRRQKVATRLLATALQSMADAGVHRVTLDVRAGNIAAQRLYRKFGFYTVTRRPRYYRDNHEDAFLMALSPLTTQALAGLGEVASPAHLVSG